MTKAAPRAPLSGPTFIRLLARIADVHPAPSSQVLTERLSQWIDWSRAVALSKALDGRPSAAPEGAPFDAAEAAACARARSALLERIQAAPLLAPQAADAAPDAAAVQRGHLELQRAMQASTGFLRGHLREMLARQSEAGARLAELDAVMELTLSPREQALLAGVPGLLGRHLERLRAQAGVAADADADAADAADAGTAPAAWLDGFRRDLHAVLLAELDLRFQPIDALLAALRPH
jgi:hypothetical protein